MSERIGPFLKVLSRDARLLPSGIVLLLATIVAVFGSALAPFNPNEIDTAALLEGPSATHLLGTDEFGRDILSRLLVGARPTLVVAFGATALAAVLGTLLGLIAGFIRGWIEQVIMRLLDVVLTFPPILLAMTVVGFLGAGVTNLIVVIGLLYVPTFGRLAYAATIQVKEIDFVDAAHALGVSRARIMARHIFPNITSSLIVQASLTAAAAILLESGLSFLGLGITPPTPSWGLMVDTARRYMIQAPTYVLWPSLTLAIVVLAINTLGDALRDVLDPRYRL